MNETLVQRLYDAWEKTDKDEALAVLHEAAVEITRLNTMQSAAPEMADTISFLLDRLSELDFSDVNEAFMRDWWGHVEPAISRASAALSKAKGEA